MAKLDEMSRPVLITDAAEAIGENRDRVYRWAKRGWIKSVKAADTRTAPILVDLEEVKSFVPPQRGWPPGVRRCKKCSRIEHSGPCRVSQ